MIRNVNPIGFNKKNGKVVKCIICGVEKYRSLAFIEHGGGKYCSLRCRSIGSNNGFKKRHGSFWNEKSKAKFHKTRLGHVVTNKTRKKISVCNKGKKKPWITGEKHYKWIKDRSKLKKREQRSDVAYKEWRRSVWLRDSFKCKLANPDCKGRLEAHHILGWKEHPELRYQVNNGITLCHAHHPRKRAEEKRLISEFKKLVSVSKE